MLLFIISDCTRFNSENNYPYCATQTKEDSNEAVTNRFSDCDFSTCKYNFYYLLYLTNKNSPSGILAKKNSAYFL